MNTNKVGLTLGVFAGLMHLIWEVLIYLGLAQSLIGWKLGMHSLSNPFIVDAFNFTTAIEMIVLAIVVGYIIGTVFATLFNYFQK